MVDRVTICKGCRGAAGERLAARLALSLGLIAEVRLAECLNACGRPLALSVRAEGKAAYLFGGVEADQDADILAFAALYREAPLGEVADARACGRLRHCLLGRIPA